MGSHLTNIYQAIFLLSEEKHESPGTETWWEFEMVAKKMGYDMLYFCCEQEKTHYVEVKSKPIIVSG